MTTFECVSENDIVTEDHPAVRAIRAGAWTPQELVGWKIVIATQRRVVLIRDSEYWERYWMGYLSRRWLDEHWAAEKP